MMASSSSPQSSEPSSAAVNGSRGTQQRGSSQRPRAENQLRASGGVHERESVHDIVKKWLPVFKKKTERPSKSGSASGAPTRNGDERNQKGTSKRGRGSRTRRQTTPKRKASDDDEGDDQDAQEFVPTLEASPRRDGTSEEGETKISVEPENGSVSFSISTESESGNTRLKFSRSDTDSTVDTQEILEHRKDLEESRSGQEKALAENSTSTIVLLQTKAHIKTSSSQATGTDVTSHPATNAAMEVSVTAAEGESEVSPMDASSEDMQALDTLLTLAEATEYCAPSMEPSAAKEENYDGQEAIESVSRKASASSLGEAGIETDSAINHGESSDSETSASRIPHEVVVKCMAAQNISKADYMPVEIVKGIYIGSVAAAVNLNTLEENRISHVVCAASGIAPMFSSKGIQYLLLDLEDEPDADILKYLEVAAQFIQKAREEDGNVLVHCFAGRSRSAAIVAAYLIRHHRMSLEEAIKTIKSKKDNVKPNRGFYYQLEQFSWGTCS
eukprot:gb/GECG01015497.1/.p1 GENE.gb/GECG01015497.1/~~gb/GECG01015497.1/.p1  ORF type:complete len:502 (+),score=88.89 gb/GECG01015497.1/:1-1506(+)